MTNSEIFKMYLHIMKGSKVKYRHVNSILYRTVSSIRELPLSDKDCFVNFKFILL